MKKYIGKLVRLNFTDIDPINGILIDFNEDWILIQSNPVDYIIDGYFVISKKNLKTVEYSKNEKWKEKVIILKNIRVPIKAKISLDNIEIIFKTLNKRYGVFTIFKKENNVCWLGGLRSIDDKFLTINDLNPKGQWKGEVKFKINKIRVIEYDTDYINSLKLVLKKSISKTGSR